MDGTHLQIVSVKSFSVKHACPRDQLAIMVASLPKGSKTDIHHLKISLDRIGDVMPTTFKIILE